MPLPSSHRTDIFFSNVCLNLAHLTRRYTILIFLDIFLFFDIRCTIYLTFSRPQYLSSHVFVLSFPTIRATRRDCNCIYIPSCHLCPACRVASHQFSSASCSFFSHIYLVAVFFLFFLTLLTLTLLLGLLWTH